MTAFVFLPHINFSPEDRIAKLVTQIVCGVLAIVLLIVLFIIFYTVEVRVFSSLLLLIPASFIGPFGCEYVQGRGLYLH